MNISRFLAHPLLRFQRGRLVFYCFLGVAFIMGLITWWYIQSTLKFAGISPIAVGAESSLLKVLLSGYFKFGIILGSALLAATYTSQRFLGPLYRIMVWIKTKELGFEIADLKLRDRDMLSYLSRLINQLYS